MIRLAVIGILLSISSILASSCDISTLCEIKEIQRITSKDKLVEFVLVHKDCGATTSTSSLVYVVPKGKEVGDSTPVFIADKVINLNISWEDSKILRIEYESARIFNFKNFWHSKEVENFKYIVSILELPIQGK